MSVIRWDILIFCVIFTTLGAVGGWFASRQTGADSTDAGGKKGAGAAVDQVPVLPPQTLRNLGVTIGKAQPESFTRYRSIPAVIERTPFNEQPVFAPIGGRIGEIQVEPGVVVKAGHALLTLVRDPIARPTLALTEDILKPAREEVHQAVVDLRKTREEIGILETELERVSKYTGNVGGEDLPILPRQTTIDLRYNLMRARRAHEQSRLELTKHGFTDQQIEEVAGGGAIPNLGQDSWKRALQANGLWTDPARQLFAVLPKKLQIQRWTIATVGELAAAGLVNPDLISWLKALGDDCAHFLEIGALIQQGYSVADVRLLHELDALEPIVRIKAPMKARVADWDVHGITAKPGSHVSSGDQLLTLLNPREMYLRVDPVGGETEDVLRAVAEGAVCEALPLVKGSGPHLTKVTITFVTSEEKSPGTTAYAKVTNTPLAGPSSSSKKVYRSWNLRDGVKYMLRVPTGTMDNVFVLPSSAVTIDGPHKVVFIPDGDSFKTLEVEIAYQDEEVAVIAINKDTKVFAGDPIVISGAYSLGLALRVSSGKVDPHAGHGH